MEELPMGLERYFLRMSLGGPKSSSCDYASEDGMDRSILIYLRVCEYSRGRKECAFVDNHKCGYVIVLTHIRSSI